MYTVGVNHTGFIMTIGICLTYRRIKSLCLQISVFRLVYFVSIKCVIFPFQNMFLPSMPQDDLEEIKEALLAARANNAGENPVFYSTILIS